VVIEYDGDGGFDLRIERLKGVIGYGGDYGILKVIMWL
jgi:hypothetical protein